MKKPKFVKVRAPTCDLLTAQNDIKWRLVGVIFAKGGVVKAVELQNIRNIKEFVRREIRSNNNGTAALKKMGRQIKYPLKFSLWLTKEAT